jgi:hypothetical protein
MAENLNEIYLDWLDDADSDAWIYSLQSACKRALHDSRVSTCDCSRWNHR